MSEGIESGSNEIEKTVRIRFSSGNVSLAV